MSTERKDCYFYGRTEAQAFVDGIAAANKGEIHSVELIARRSTDGPYYVVRWVDEDTQASEKVLLRNFEANALLDVYRTVGMVAAIRFRRQVQGYKKESLTEHRDYISTLVRLSKKYSDEEMKYRNIRTRMP